MPNTNNIEIRSEEVQEIIGTPPSRIIRSGITSVFIIICLLVNRNKKAWSQSPRLLCCIIAILYRVCETVQYATLLYIPVFMCFRVLMWVAKYKIQVMGDWDGIFQILLINSLSLFLVNNYCVYSIPKKCIIIISFIIYTQITVFNFLSVFFVNIEICKLST